MKQGIYQCTVRHKVMNQMIANAGLGLTGYTDTFNYVVTWEEGEVVSKIRANSLCDHIKDAINLTQEHVECVKVEFLRLETV
jgi:hypothetical protein